MALRPILSVPILVDSPAELPVNLASYAEGQEFRLATTGECSMVVVDPVTYLKSLRLIGAKGAPGDVGKTGDPGPAGPPGPVTFAVLSLFVDPQNGNDTNPGTAGSPLQSFNAGVYPKLVPYSKVTVTYVGTATDSVPAALYVLPPYCSLTINSPWVDIGLTVRTVASSGSSKTQVTDLLAGLPVDVAEGSRLRWLTSAAGMAGQAYSIVGNSASTYTIGEGGLAAVPASGDTFVLERATGGWTLAPSAMVILDVCAPGCALATAGFKILFTGGGYLSITGQGTPVTFVGLYVEGNSTSWTLALYDVNVRWGWVAGYPDFPAQLGLRGTGCYFHGTSNVANYVYLTQCHSWSVDAVCTSTCWNPENGNDRHATLILNALGGVRATYQASASALNLVNIYPRNNPWAFLQIGMIGTVPDAGCTGSIFNVVVDTTSPGATIQFLASTLTLYNFSGTTGFGTFTTYLGLGTRLTQYNCTATGASASAAVRIGGLAPIAWPAQATGVVSDLTLAQVTAGTSQSCFLYSR